MNSPELRHNGRLSRAETVLTALRCDKIGLIDLVFGLDKVSNWCAVDHLWLDELILSASDVQTSIVCAGVLSRCLSIWLLQGVGYVVYSRSLCEFFALATVSRFSLVHQMTLTSVDDYFQQLYWMAQSWTAVCFIQFRGIAILRTNIIFTR